MKIYINAVPPQGLDMEETIEPSALDLNTDQICFSRSLQVRAHIKKDKDILTVDCNVKSIKRQICSRCLAELDIPLEKEMNFIYKLSGECTIELNDKIKDEIILDYPLKILCRPDCKGLCLHCGKNLNQGPCECKM